MASLHSNLHLVIEECVRQLWGLPSLLLLCALAAAFISSRKYLDWARHCENCGYSLEGLPRAGPCPECGSAYRPRRVVRTVWIVRESTLWLAPVAMIVMMVAPPIAKTLAARVWLQRTFGDYADVLLADRFNWKYAVESMPMSTVLAAVAIAASRWMTWRVNLLVLVVAGIAWSTLCYLQVFEHPGPLFGSMPASHYPTNRGTWSQENPCWLAAFGLALVVIVLAKHEAATAYERDGDALSELGGPTPPAQSDP